MTAKKAERQIRVGGGVGGADRVQSREGECRF